VRTVGSEGGVSARTAGGGDGSSRKLGIHMKRKLREAARPRRQFVEAMAQGPCLCAEIDPKDRPCLTCEAQTAIAPGAP
jgi:hypothetical protein